MEQNENPESHDSPPPAAPAAGSGLFYRDGREIPPTHPDHGPMHLLPRQEDGGLAAHYYCSKAELYDAGILKPPPRRQRRDGFGAERQEEFLEAVRGGASGREAARRVGISPTTAYNLYNSPDGAAFRQAWDEAARVVDIVLEDTAFDRAVNGQEETVYYKGERVGVRLKYDNNLLMKLIRARNPLKYAPLSEIEGWLRNRGIAPPTDVDGALDRLRSAEAEWGRRLPGEEAVARIEDRRGAAPRSPGAHSQAVRPALVEGPAFPSDEQGRDGPAAGSGPTEEGGDAAAAASTSFTSSGNERSENASAESTSSTSSGNGQPQDPAAVPGNARSTPFPARSVRGRPGH